MAVITITRGDGHRLHRQSGRTEPAIWVEWDRRKNSFKGCIDAGCPLLATCTRNAEFAGCPSDDPELRAVFAKHNPAANRRKGRNRVFNWVFNKHRDDLIGAANAAGLGISHIIAGTGTLPTDPTWTALQIEGYRAPLVKRKATSTGKGTFYWYIPPDEGIGSWTEWALGANFATNAAGTGYAFNRWPDTINKTADDTVTGQFSILYQNPS
jgi:hypothetical protein